MPATHDLMTDVSADVTAAMLRSLDLAVEKLPVATAGGAAAIGIIAAVLDTMGGSYDKTKRPSNDCILLAALVCARMGGDFTDPIAQAYKDLERLKHTGD